MTAILRLSVLMGPMGRSVRDMTELLDVMVGYDPEDPVTALGYGKAPVELYQVPGQGGLKGARIGVIPPGLWGQVLARLRDFKQVDAFS